MNEKIAKELVKARQDVKRKYRILKSNIAETAFQQEKALKPIVQPLQELVKNIKLEQSFKKEPLSPQLFSTPEKTFLPPAKRRQTNIYRKYLPSHEIPSFLNAEETFQTDDYDDDVFFDEGQQSVRQNPLSSTRVNDLDETTITAPTLAEMRQDILNLTKGSAYDTYLESFHPLVRDFIDKSIKGERDTDHTHGLVHDVKTEKFKIGDSPADFDKQNFKVQGLTYEGTPGLYELLFFEDPRGYTSADLDNYMDILKRTNAYRRNYDPNEQIQGTTDPKYLTIIKPYLREKKILKTASTSGPFVKPKPPLTRTRSTRISSKKEGMGMMMDLTNKKTDYVYFDNPNELVERLKLLISSQNAGHTGHNNEIVSIIEELREAKVIL